MYLIAYVLFFFATQRALGADLPAESAVCVACRADLDGIRNGYSGDDWHALTRGEIVTSTTSEPQADGSVQSNVESSAIIASPATQVWSVVADFEARPKFIPDLKEMRVMRVDGNRLWLAERVRFFLVNIRYQVVATLDAERGLATWILDTTVQHDIAGNHGSWQIAPLPSGQETLVQYQAWVDSGRPVPRFIADFLIKRSLPKVIEGLRHEVQRRFRP